MPHRTQYAPTRMAATRQHSRRIFFLEFGFVSSKWVSVAWVWSMVPPLSRPTELWGPLASILRNTFFPGTKTRRWEKTAVFDKAMVRLYYMEYTGKNQHGGRGYFPFAFFPQDIYFL